MKTLSGGDICAALKEFEEAFTTKTYRHDGEEPKTKYLLKDGEAKEFYSDIIYKCHDGIMPNDWIFEKVWSLLAACNGYSDPRTDDSHEIIDSCVDIYTTDLYEWGKRFGHYVDEAREQGVIEGTEPIERQLMAGQFIQLQSIFNIILEGVSE